jgi:pimeloyl-ACP methyl ester carboxylesterase
VLDQYGVIFISAAQSGNDADVYGRRIPLALNAATNILQRYAVDPQRVYVGGTSGGSRVAMRVALAYPDLFHGAMLNAGSDEIDNDYIPLPPRDLFYQFQSSTRLIYITGDADSVNLNKDAASRGAMRDWCQFNTDSEVMLWTGHGVADAGSLLRVLKLLQTPLQTDEKKLAACRSAIDQDMEAQLARAGTLNAAGKRAETKALLGKIDRCFGGLAAPRSVSLDAALEGQAN